FGSSDVAVNNRFQNLALAIGKLFAQRHKCNAMNNLCDLSRRVPATQLASDARLPPAHSIGALADSRERSAASVAASASRRSHPVGVHRTRPILPSADHSTS